MRAQIRHSKTHIYVVCEMGHLITLCSLKDWAGSMFEAECSFHHEGDRFERLASKCQGYGHKKEEVTP